MNQAFCRFCQTQCSEEQQQDPCKVTQETLFSQGVKLGEVCPECKHTVGSHPSLEIQKAILAPTAVQTQGRKRFKMDVVESWILKAKALINVIDSADTSKLNDPAVMHELPFPSIGTLPEDRFSVSNEDSTTIFKFMGRTTISQVLSEIEKISTMKTINIYGTKGYGKSHIIAAVVVKLMQENSRQIIFLPNAHDLAKAPVPYLKQALLVAFARDEEKSKEVAELKTVQELSEWAIEQPFVLVVDQMNSIEDGSRLAEDDKRSTRSLIKTLFGYSQLTVYGFSANNQSMVHQQVTQRSERDVGLFGGFSEQEYLAWLGHHACFKPNEDQRQSIAYDTGRVPMYLSRLFQRFLSISGNCFIGIGAYLNMKKAIELYKDDLAIECEEPLMNFYASTGDQHTNRIESAKQLLRGEKPSLGAEFMDHQFFYVQARSSHAVCGVAKEFLAVILRSQLGVHADDYFLSNDYIQTCLRNTNPAVKRFEAEQIVISAINKHGLRICGTKSSIPIGETVHFRSSREAALSKKAVCHYIPEPFNYKHIDSLVRVQHFESPRSKKVESVDMYAIKCTMPPDFDHRGRFEFFNECHKQWQETAKNVRWHFVWIIPAKHNNFGHLQGRVRGWVSQLNGLEYEFGSDTDFHEWWYSYGDVVDGLKSL